MYIHLHKSIKKITLSIFRKRVILYKCCCKFTIKMYYISKIKKLVLICKEKYQLLYFGGNIIFE